MFCQAQEVPQSQLFWLGWGWNRKFIFDLGENTLWRGWYIGFLSQDNCCEQGPHRQACPCVPAHPAEQQAWLDRVFWPFLSSHLLKLVTLSLWALALIPLERLCPDVHVFSKCTFLMLWHGCSQMGTDIWCCWLLGTCTLKWTAKSVTQIPRVSNSFCNTADMSF